ncbi:uncharacterized protein LOC110728886 [Chenopodium quinoa]|uniref:uncharacterized protein LOC110728886 n=1 Tax=Chenopodium quinoa TaxID=63459 RepID=UPI000B76CE15|nr:uncharacterized protein LOC110728886 [Chenopodium quinoa]
MYLNPRSEATWCKYFPTTLKSVAQSWITKGVKEGSISGWKDLSNKFKSKFSTANRREKTTAELMSLQQAEDESLHDYLTRFSNESSRITSLDQGLAVFALRNGLQVGKGWESERTTVRGPYVEPKALEPSSAAEPKKEKFVPYAGRYDSYTPLTLPHAKIYITTRDEGRFKKPRPLPPWHQQKGKDRWCEFHESPEHRTEDCLQLKDQIEDLVQKNYLKKYLTDCREEKKAERDSQQDLDFLQKKGKQQDKDILDILAIFEGTSRSVVKCHLRGLTHQVNHAKLRAPQSPVPNILFTTEHCQGVVYPHDDPLVIVMGIANCNVWRTLVDGGSGANILFRGAFDQLKMEAKHLSPVPYPVSGFNGSSSYPDGKTLLPVTVDKGRAVRCIMVEFLVVDAPSVYNVIMGRPLIHDIQGVVLTYHQTMIYVSVEGHSERIKGSQKEARRCNHLKPSKGRRSDQDDEEEKERDHSAKNPRGLRASAQGTPAKEKSIRGEKASSSSEPKDSEDQPKSRRHADIDSKPKSEESSAKAMELDN